LPTVSTFSGRIAMSKRGITRRGFVKGVAAAAVSAPFLAARSALGADQKPSPSDRLTLGFIGMGTQNGGHLGHFLGQKDAQVLAVCDVDTTRREHAKQRVEEKYAAKTKSG